MVSTALQIAFDQGEANCPPPAHAHQKSPDKASHLRGGDAFKGPDLLRESLDQSRHGTVNTLRVGVDREHPTLLQGSADFREISQLTKQIPGETGGNGLHHRIGNLLGRFKRCREKRIKLRQRLKPRRQKDRDERFIPEVTAVILHQPRHQIRQILGGAVGAG